MSRTVTITALTGIPQVRAGDDLAALLLAGLADAGLALAAGDVLVVSSKIVSKAHGLTAALADRETAVAAESVAVLAERATPTHVARVVRARAGPVMASAGVDASNTGAPGVVLTLPREPDEVCRDLLARLARRSGVEGFGVVLTDTAGRPWRAGQTDFALGACGITVLDDLRGRVDADGRRLDVTARAVADEIAAAADLVKGKVTGCPAALVRGLDDLVGLDASAAGAGSLVRSGDADWFALGAQEAVRAALGVPPGSAAAERAGIRPAGPGPEPRDGRVARAVAVALAAAPDALIDTAVVDNAVVDNAGVDNAVVDTAVVDTSVVDTAVVDTAMVDTAMVDNAVVDIRGDRLEVSAEDPVVLGMVAARLLTALAGEGVVARAVRRGAGVHVVLG